MSRSLLVFLLVTLLALSCSKAPQDSLEKGFNTPPVSARPKGYWCLVDGNFDLSQMTYELKDFKEKGVGTLDIWDVSGWVDEQDVIPPGPPFMGDESVQAIAHAIREAGKIGMDIGLTISSSWNAGGSWIKPEHGVMGLFSSTIEVAGERTIQEEIPFPSIPEYYDGRRKNILFKNDKGLPTYYKEVAVLAYKVEADSSIGQITDISEFFTAGILQWEAPAGNWKITRYVCTGSGQPLMNPSPNSNGPMIDHFSAEAMEFHLNFFFVKLEKELGDLSKTALKYLYTDSYEANTAAWTPLMPEEFKSRAGYDITPWLPALEGFILKDNETTERFLFDFRKVLSDLIIENHYALGKKLCNEKGLEFIAEAGGPGPPIHNCPFESLRSLGSLSASRGEFWFDTMWEQEKIDGLQIIKGPASAAHLYNLPRVEAEAFTGTQLWRFGPGDLKSTADRALCEGLTSFVYHTSPHIPREAGLPGWVYNFGTLVNTTRTWWPLSSGFHQYLGRSCFMLQQGNFVADVLYYYGDKAPNFVDPKHIDPSLGFGYDYDVTNSDIILNRLDVANGYFVLPHGQKYKLLVLPIEVTMNPQVLEKLEYLVQKGGIVVGKKPERSYSLHMAEENDTHIKSLADKLWPTADYRRKLGKGWVYNAKLSLRDILAEQEVMPDVQVAGSDREPSLDFIHRETSEADIYFFRNTSAEEKTFNLKLRSDRGAPELWNPATAEKNSLPVYVQENDQTQLPLCLEGYGSVFVIFRGNSCDKHMLKISRNSETLFPSDQATFPYAVDNNQVIPKAAGNFELSYTDGSLEQISVDSPEYQTLQGAWEIRFPYGWGTPGRATWDTLISWTASENDNIKHFSGTATYLKNFAFNNKNNNTRTYLDLGEVSKVARVYLNGNELGIRWFSPYRYEISDYLKNEQNYLVVEVANVFSNQLTGDAYRKGADKRTHTNITRGPNAWMTPHEELDLVPSGLMGPVTLQTYHCLGIE